jgi:hypothetical protein
MSVGSERFCRLAQETVLSNDLLTKWLLELEKRLQAVEASLSLKVTWGVSQDELAETEERVEK